MRLTEEQIRAKVVELLDGMSQVRMDLWVSSGILAGVLDARLVDRVLAEEVVTRSHEVKMFWLGECNCDGHLN